MKNIFIDLLAFGTLFSSVLVITSKNPVIAVTFLIAVFVNAAGYLILLGIGFVGIAYLIVYVGAITVLFLFVIMLLNIRLSEIIETSTNFTKNLPLALIICLLFIYELLTIIPFHYSDLSLITILFDMLQSINNILINNFDINNTLLLLNTEIFDETTKNIFFNYRSTYFQRILGVQQSFHLGQDARYFPRVKRNNKRGRARNRKKHRGKIKR